MTPDQADYVLAQMSVCWPGKPLSVPEVKFWVSKLEAYEFDDAHTALTKIADRAKFWPSWAEFKEFVDIEKRNNTPALARAPEAPPLSDEEFKQRIQECRDALNKKRAGEKVEEV